MQTPRIKKIAKNSSKNSTLNEKKVQKIRSKTLKFVIKQKVRLKRTRKKGSCENWHEVETLPENYY